MSASAAPLDFLTRVALPALGVVPMVRPRLPSLFEDRRVDPEDDGQKQTTEPRRESPPLWRAMMPPPLTVTQSPAPPVPAGQATTLPKVNPLDLPRPEPLIPTRAATALVHPVPPDPVAAVPPVATKRHSGGDEQVPPAALRPAVQSLETRTTPAAIPERLKRRSEHNAEPQQPGPKARQSTDGFRREEARQIAVSPQPVRPYASPIVRPLVMPAPLPVPSRREAVTVQLPPASPAITITIGRIDIRAATALPTTPTPAPRAARREPQSLDDYLKSRTGRS